MKESDFKFRDYPKSSQSKIDHNKIDLYLKKMIKIV